MSSGMCSDVGRRVTACGQAGFKIVGRAPEHAQQRCGCQVGVDRQLAEETQAAQRSVPVRTEVAPPAVVLLIAVVVLHAASVALVITISRARHAKMPAALLIRQVRAQHVFVQGVTLRPFSFRSMEPVRGDGRETTVHNSGIQSITGAEGRDGPVIEMACPAHSAEETGFIGGAVGLQAAAPAGSAGGRTESREAEGLPNHEPLPESCREVAQIPALVAACQ